MAVSMARIRTLLLVFSFTALFSGTVAAGGLHVYKWVDSTGVLHYSDKAPAAVGDKVTLMELPALPPPNPQEEARTQAWIASINQLYQRTLEQEAQQQHAQELAWENAQMQNASSAPQFSQATTYAVPVYWPFGLHGLRHRHHEPDRDDFMHPFHGDHDTPPVFRPSPPDKLPSSFPPNRLPSSFPEEVHKF